MSVGAVAEIWVFPVKSMQGTSLPRVEVEASGLRGDRAWAVVAADGTPVTAAQEPRLRQVSPHLRDGLLTLDVPGSPAGLAVDEAGEALSAWLQRPVRLAHREGGGFVDVAPVHVVSTGSIGDAEHAEQCDACDVAQPRANLVLTLADDGPAERTWVGSTLRVGGAVIRVVRHPKHCLGVYADVLDPGPVTVGDTVQRD